MGSMQHAAGTQQLAPRRFDVVTSPFDESCHLRRHTLVEGIALRARVYDQPALTCMFGDEAAVVLGANIAQLRQPLQGQAGEAEPVLPERQRAGGERIIQALEALLDERLRMFDQLLAISAGKQAEGDLRAWLFTILYRLFLDGQRRSRRYARVLQFFTGDEPQAASAEEVTIARSTLDAFAGLTTEQRVLLLLVGVEGLSYREVAETLDVPIGTVMSRLSRARNALREASEGQITQPQLRLIK